MPPVLNIIIADDHAIFRFGLTTMLEMNGHIKVIAEAANGEELIGLVKQFKPHVVLTDMIMPVLTGIEAIRKMKEDGNLTPCIALSTFNNEHLIVDAMEAGAAGYIIKMPRKEKLNLLSALYMKGIRIIADLLLQKLQVCSSGAHSILMQKSPYLFLQNAKKRSLNISAWKKQAKK